MNDEFDERRQNRKLFKSLPQWFCFANYQSVNNLDPLGWYVQITCRQVCFSYLIFMRDPDPFVDEKLPIVKRALARLRKDPICDLSRSPFNDGVFSLCHGLDFPDGPVVRSMTLWDLCLIDRNVRLKLSQDENDVAQRIASDRSPSVLLYHPPEWMKATVDDAGLSNSTLPLVIDLSFPNSVLQRHFEAYLQKLRLHGKPEQAGKHSADLSAWAKGGLLPCLDLLLWAEQQNGRIPDRLIADAIGAARVTEENIRKTIRPLAERILNLGPDPTVLTRLRAFAYADTLQRKLTRDRIHSKKAIQNAPKVP